MSRYPWIEKKKKREHIHSERDSFYHSEEWREKRKAALYLNPFCAIGRRAGQYDVAKDLDHIIPRQYDGHPLSDDNLQLLAHNQHSKKTNIEIIKKGPLYESITFDGFKIPLRRWGKLVPKGRQPVVIVMGPPASGKSALIEAMAARTRWDHVHDATLSGWSNVSRDIQNVPGCHLVECHGNSKGFIKMLLKHRLSFYIIRCNVLDSSLLLKKRPKLDLKEYHQIKTAAKVIPSDVTIYPHDSLQEVADNLTKYFNL